MSQDEGRRAWRYRRPLGGGIPLLRHASGKGEDDGARAFADDVRNALTGHKLLTPQMVNTFVDYLSQARAIGEGALRWPEDVEAQWLRAVTVRGWLIVIDTISSEVGFVANVTNDEAISPAEIWPDSSRVRSVPGFDWTGKL